MKRRSVINLSIAAIPVILFGWWYYAAFIAPNHPQRPSNVPPSATLVLQGFAAFWQKCWFDENLHKDRCQIFNRNGVILRDEIFLSYDGKATIPANRLKIVSGGGWDYIHLQDGSILIPQQGYEAIREVIAPPERK